METNISKRRRTGNPCCLCVCIFPNFCKNKRITRSFCCMSVCVCVRTPLIFFLNRMFMGEPCCLCIPPNFFVSCAARVVRKESRRLVLPRAYCLYSTSMIYEICHCRQTPPTPLSLPQSELIRSKGRQVMFERSKSDTMICNYLL
jgi:hypothetical protein